MEEARLEWEPSIRRRGPAIVSTSNDINRIDELSDDLLLQILARVGCSQSATLCKCVSKRWYGLISSPSFIAGFLSQSSKNQLPFSFLCDSVGSSGFKKLFPRDSAFESHRGFSFDFLPHELPSERCGDPKSEELLPLHAQVVGALYDLVILEVFRASYNHIAWSREPHVNFLVCNPLTMKWAWLLPIPRVSMISSKVGFICKAYDPIDQPASRQDHYQCEYRVVRIHAENFTEAVPIDMFSSETQLWEQHVLSCPLQGNDNPILSDSVEYKGKLHWLTREHIVVFDPFQPPELEGGLVGCSLISWPAGSLYTLAVLLGVCLGVCNGYLRISIGHPPYSFMVWELKDYNMGEWNFMHNISYSEFEVPKFLHGQGHTPIEDALSCIFVLGFHPYNENIIYVECRSFILSCNLQSKVLEVIPEIKLGGYPYLLMLPRWPTPLLSPSNRALL